MSLPNSAPRKLLHTRSITYAGFQREDGFWDIEAQLTDVKTYSLDPGGDDDIPAGTAMHDVQLRVTLDDALKISAIESSFDHFPLNTCPAVTANYQSLVGLTIGAGWRKALKQRVGGETGCTHITEMLGSMATPAIQTIGHALSVQNPQPRKTGTPPHRVGRCHSWATDSPAVKKYEPEYYTGD
tara:strand:- start:2846 stop:3397 length:552 start_codon:yes stop_codon:yes gene_type:complete